MPEKNKFSTPEKLYLWHVPQASSTQLVGEIHGERNGDVSLQYTQNWIESGFALSQDLALNDRKYTPLHRRMRESAAPGALDDACPDRWGEKVIRYLYKPGATLRDYLYFAGDERFGTLGVSKSASEYTPFRKGVLPRMSDAQDLSDAAKIIANGEGELSAQKRSLLSVGASLGGAKPKAVIEIDGEEWVIKFSNGEHWDQPLIEHACMRLAASVGIAVAHTQSIKLQGEHALLVKRFDRIGKQRIHCVSASTLLRAATPQGQEVQYGYPQLARRLRAVGHAARLHEHLENLFRRMILNILIGNTDDHEKNHAVTYQFHRGTPRIDLSPAYDVVTTGSGAWAHEFQIADDVVEPSLESALSVCADFALDETQAHHIIKTVATQVDGWATQFRGIGVSARDIEALEEFIDHPKLKEQRQEFLKSAAPRNTKRSPQRSSTARIFK